MKNNESVIVAINPGSTHDEVAVFNGDRVIFKKSISYSLDDLRPFEELNVSSQFEFRKNMIKESLRDEGIKLDSFDAVIGRGGLLHPIEGGVYEINDDMLEDLKSAKYGDHPSNLGAMLAYSLGKALGIPSYIADSVVTDEMLDLARYTGVPSIKRRSVFHCLNQKKVGYLTAKKINKPYNECNFIVAHAGAGITIGAHYKGKVIDVNSGLDGEGPFTPQRTGGLPVVSVAKLILDKSYTFEELKVLVNRRGGLRKYMGTSDLKLIVKYIKGEDLSGEDIINTKVTPDEVKSILESMCYQVSKEICSLTASLKGVVDAVILTGGIMHDKEFCLPWIKERVSWIAPVYVFPGGDELEALKDSVVRVLSGEEKTKEYVSWKEN